MLFFPWETYYKKWFFDFHYSSLYIDVYLGAQNVLNLTEPGRINVRVYAENIVVHNGFNPTVIANDIAILRLPEPVDISGKFSANR